MIVDTTVKRSVATKDDSSNTVDHQFKQPIKKSTMNKPIWAINLRTARKLQKLTQQELADKIFKDRSTYSGYENGDQEPDLATWYIILDILEIRDMIKFLYQDYFKEENKAA